MMIAASPDPMVAGMVQRIVRALSPLRVVLFGSRATGTARPDSDVDLVVELPPGADTQAGLRTVRETLADREVALDCLVVTTDQVQSCQRYPNHIITTAYADGVQVHGPAT